MTDMISIEVVYGTPSQQQIITLQVNPGTRVEQGITQSGILTQHPDIDLSKTKVGVWNRVCRLDDELSHLDRIEIYRPLIADPKDVRRRRAEKAIKEGRADKVTGGRPNQIRK